MSRVYLAGLCGSGMRALGEFLRDREIHVAGHDHAITLADEQHFAQLGIATASPQQLDLGAHSPQLVVHSAAVPASDPARQQARAAGLADWSYPQFVGWLLAHRRGLCIAGTHGKSTTTALTGWLLQGLGLSPGLLVGAEFRGLGRSGWDEGGPPLVVESCEYQRHFLNYNPASAAILSVEPDHFDCYSSAADLLETYQQFAGGIQPSGTLVIPGESLGEIPWNSFTTAQVVQVGRTNGPASLTWTYDLMQWDRSGLQIRIRHQQRPWADVRLPPGPGHNALNALAAIALCGTMVNLHSPDSKRLVIEGLQTFPGLSRRFEIADVGDQRTLIDDYAHHPTALTATIEAARRLFPGRRLVGVFQPHQASRTRALFPQFVEALSQLDLCFLTPVYAARETVGPAEAARLADQLSQEVSRRGTPSEMLFALDPIPRTLDDSLRSGDLLLTLGAGNISRLHHAFIQRFRRDHPAR